MSHHVNGFIGPFTELQRLTKGMSHAKIAHLRVNDLGFLPFTHELSNEIGNKWYDLGKQAQVPIAHVETDYFGGFGDQSAAVWKNGKKVFKAKSSGGPINEALALIGVKAKEGDAFDTVGLGQYRNNETWAEVGLAAGEQACQHCLRSPAYIRKEHHAHDCPEHDADMMKKAQDWLNDFTQDGSNGVYWRGRYYDVVKFLLEKLKQ